MTEEMVEQEGETRGVLLCKKQDSIFVVHSIIKIGLGSAGGVQGNDRYIRAMRKLLQENAGFGLRSIDFHTHTTSTPSYYNDKFSDFENGGGDFGTLRKYLTINDNYTHVLFTPTHVLTFGKSKPSFKLSNKENPDVWNLFKHWNNEFKKKLLLERHLR